MRLKIRKGKALKAQIYQTLDNKKQETKMNNNTT